jgi:hypothetical protein
VATSLRERFGVPNLGALLCVASAGQRRIARAVPHLEAMAHKPFKDITDRQLFAGHIMAAFTASDPQANGRPCQPRRRGGRPSGGAQGAGRGNPPRGAGARTTLTTGTHEPGCRLFLCSCQLRYTANIMAKLTKSGSLAALAEGQPAFSSGTGRFTIGIAGRDGTTWHVYLTATEAREFVDYVDEHT